MFDDLIKFLEIIIEKDLGWSDMVYNTICELLNSIKSETDDSVRSGLVSQYLNKLSELGFDDESILNDIKKYANLKKEKNFNMNKIVVEKSTRIPGTNIILEKGDRVFFYGKNHKLNEDFKLGSARDVAKKMCDVIGRKIGKNLKLIGFPYSIKTEFGESITFYGECDKFNFGVSFNRGKSDEISGFYLFENKGKFDKPTRYVDLQGYNIIQVIGQICDVFSGAFDKYYESSSIKGNRLTEKVTDDIASWLDANPDVIERLQKKQFNPPTEMNNFISYCSANNLKTKSVSVDMMKWYVQHYCQAKGITYKKGSLPVANVAPVKNVQKVEVELSPEDQQLFESASRISAKEKWDDFLYYVYQVVNKARGFSTMIAYGTPGTGKTYDVEKILNTEGIPYHKIGSTIKDVDDIITLIYQYRDTDVVLFDDCDSILSSPVRANIAKQLFDSKDVRYVGMNTSFTRIIDGQKIEVPSVFEVSARFIVLSNQPREKFNSAVMSRVKSVELLFSREEMLELVMSKIDQLGASMGITLDDIDHNQRLLVYEVMMTFESKYQKDINLRLFEQCMNAYLIARDRFAGDETKQKREILKYLLS